MHVLTTGTNQVAKSTESLTVRGTRTLHSYTLTQNKKTWGTLESKNMIQNKLQENGYAFGGKKLLRTIQYSKAIEFTCQIEPVLCVVCSNLVKD